MAVSQVRSTRQPCTGSGSVSETASFLQAFQNERLVYHFPGAVDVYEIAERLMALSSLFLDIHKRWWTATKRVGGMQVVRGAPKY